MRDLRSPVLHRSQWAPLQQHVLESLRGQESQAVVIPFMCERIPQGDPRVVLSINDTFIVHMSPMDARRLSVALAAESNRMLGEMRADRRAELMKGAK